MVQKERKEPTFGGHFRIYYFLEYYLQNIDAFIWVVNISWIFLFLTTLNTNSVFILLEARGIDILQKGGV